jgi:predicted MFS family arabinose efflux permease
MIVMGILGNLAGGFMPSIFNSYLGSASGTVSAFGYRLALLISMVLALVAAIPLLLMKQAKRKERTMSEILNFKNIKSSKIMLKLALPVGLIGFGAGFIVPLLNLFFAGKFAATTEEIGILNALSNVTLVVGTLSAPVMSRKLGKVKAIALCEFLSMPFIMLMTLSPVLPLAGFAFITRNALMNMAGPVSGTFQMEMVTETERATTNGLLVTADNIPRAITASVSGGMMASGDYFTPFLATTCSYLFASSLFYLFFRNAESQKPASQASNVS